MFNSEINFENQFWNYYSKDTLQQLIYKIAIGFLIH